MNKRKDSKKIIYQKGQAVLLVLLGMAAVLTVALSVASKSVSDISTVSRSENSSRAFSAAEEGVEALLFDPTLSNYVGEGEIDASAKKYGENETEVILKPIKTGESDTLWFVSHDDDNNLTCTPPAICFIGDEVRFFWGKDDEVIEPAIEISFYYDSSRDSLGSSPDFSGVEVARVAYDPVGSRRSSNNFTAPDSIGYTVAGESFKYRAIVTLSDLGDLSGLLFARIRAIYNNGSTKIGAKIVSGGDVFPAQGRKVKSTGTISDATRKIEVIQYYREPLDIFDTAIMSFGTNAGLK